MIHSTSVRLAGAGLGAAALGFGLPLLAGTSTASAQTAPATAACTTATPSATASATPTATTTPGGVGGIIGGVIASISPSASPASATPTASTTPSPCPTSTATTSPSATATATTTPSATTTVTTSPSATPTATATTTACPSPLGISLSRGFVTPGVPSTVTVTGPAGAVIELQAYSRPSTTYGVVRRGVIGNTGRTSFDVTPGTNTRLFAACTGQTQSASASTVLNVRTALSLTVVRNGVRNYTFQGRLLPRRAGQLVTLYRVQSDGTRILTSQLKSDSTGTYRFNRRFTGSGRFGFLTRTGQTLTNQAGESNTPQTTAGVNNGRGTPRPTAIF